MRGPNAFVRALAFACVQYVCSVGGVLRMVVLGSGGLKCWCLVFGAWCRGGRGGSGGVGSDGGVVMRGCIRQHPRDEGEKARGLLPEPRQWSDG